MSFLRVVFSLSILVASIHLQAATISNSGDEIQYEYTVTFKSRHQAKLTKSETLDEAAWHATHVDGLFHAAKYAERFGVATDLSEGYGGSKYPEVVEASSELVDESVWVTYTATAKALVLKPVLEAWIGEKKRGEVELPMPTDMTKVYTDDLGDYVSSKWKKCTDSHYQDAIDFYYFYDPFRAEGDCEALGKAPIGQMVKFKIERVNNTSATNSAKIPKEEIHGDNGNGKLVTLYFINGFDDLAAGATFDQIQKDYGWKSYKILEKYMEENGFERAESKADLEKMLGEQIKNIDITTYVTFNAEPNTDTPVRLFYSTYVKTEGNIKYVVRSALFPTENKEEGSNTLVSFPKFWKEAWENGDFIYYGGHSGSGHHLSLDVMLSNLQAKDLSSIKFKKNKTQIAYLDSCSSYAHFVEQYSAKNPENLTIMSYGLVSLFHLAEASVKTTLDILTVDKGETKWIDALKRIEQSQLKPHVEFMWEAEDADEMFEYFNESEQYPALLLNVWVP